MRDETITIENDDLRVEVVAHRGGRIRRLTNCRDGRDWLSPPRGVGSTMPTLDDVFTETDHFGWDEMLPTVDRCTYESEPYAGVALADHGELWTAEWEVIHRTPTLLHQRVEGQRLKYRFDRILALRGPVLRCEYQCEVPVDTFMLWAAHPQFFTLNGTRLQLQPTPVTVFDTSTGSARAIDWRGDLVVERDVEPGTDIMLYVDPTSTVESAILLDLDGGALTMTWDTRSAPYVGIWADRGRYSAGRVIAIEPTNGYFDDFSRAVANQRAKLFVAHVPETWWLEVAVTSKGEDAI